jgi:hypothetical protein
VRGSFKGLFVIIISLLMFVIFEKGVSAEGKTANPEQMVSYIHLGQLHPKQDKNKTNVISLFGVKPNQEEIVELEIKNTTKYINEITLYTKNVITNHNLDSDFSDSNKVSGGEVIDQDFLLKDNIQIIPSAFTLKPNEIQKISVKIKTPQKNIGKYVSSIVQETTPKNLDGKEMVISQKKGNKTLNQTVKTDFRMMVYLNMEQNESTKEIINFGQPNFVSDRSNAFINVPITNNSALYLWDLKGKNSVLDESGKEIQKQSFIIRRFTPMTKVNFDSVWNGTIKDGNYTVKTKITIGKKVYENSSQLIISRKQVNNANKTIDSSKKVVVDNGLPNWAIILICGITVLLLILVFIIVKLISKNKKYKINIKEDKDI